MNSGLTYTTPEAVLICMSDIWTDHPDVKNVRGKIAKLSIDLPQNQATLTQELIQQRSGLVILHLRSVMAQLGLEAFEKRVTEMRLIHRELTIETLVSDMRIGQNSPLLRTLKTLMTEMPVKIAHAGLFPDAAKICTVEFPIAAGYRFVKEFSPKDIGCMLSSGSARQYIQDHRIREDVPATLPVGSFFVGGVNAGPYNGHNVLLDPVVRIDGRPSDHRQHQSLILQKGRSLQQGNGDSLRQVEIRIGKTPLRTAAAGIGGTLYHAAENAAGV